MPDSPQIFGVRHHGPGSARSLVKALTTFAPDCLLIEGPPDADGILGLAGHIDMTPPVALLVYDPEKPQRSCFYPFAVFSPEWQAIQYGLNAKIPVRLMDLPQSIQIALRDEAEQPLLIDQPEPTPEEAPADTSSIRPLEPPIVADPLAPLARAAGYDDTERWWEQMVEHRGTDERIFEAIMEAMAALREAALTAPELRRDERREALREAHMRQTIRAAQKEGFQRIAVVCGAWHAPVLANRPAAKTDAALLKGLPKRKVVSTWIPWTYSRLSIASGYGAGIQSPGWYHFLWSSDKRGEVALRWLAQVARLLREEDLDASSASLIEAVRLAEGLAALRGHSLPGLPELNEATQTALCFGDSLPLRLIAKKLIISERLGETPEETPTVPLARDLAHQQKRLRLPPEAGTRQLDLDLRKPNDLARSHLLHRLKLLGIEWGEFEEQRGTQKGTFHELWSLQWDPEYSVKVIETAIWGNTVAEAAGAKLRHVADTATQLATLTELLTNALLAELPEATPHLIARLQAIAAVATDVAHLMDALLPLANVVRYGNVRQTDGEMVRSVVDGLIARICVGLPGATGGLNEEAAEEMFTRLTNVHAAISLLQNAEHPRMWNALLRQLADAPNQHGLLAGRATRLLLDSREISNDEGARRFGLALSSANAPASAAAWLDGFVRKSGLLLIHDRDLWSVLDDWVSTLSGDHFTATLPLLRRTFSTFESGERRQLGARVASGSRGQTKLSVPASDLDEERANRVLPLLAQLLGLKHPK